MKDDCNIEAIIHECNMYRDTLERLLFAIDMPVHDEAKSHRLTDALREAHAALAKPQWYELMP
jgi:hypothetical protein